MRSTSEQGGAGNVVGLDENAGRGVPESAAARAATQRSQLYGFLAAVFGAEPGAALLRVMRTPPLRQALIAAGAVPADLKILDGPEDRVLADLGVEYTRLFIGPGPHVSPFASVHLGGEGGSLWGPSTVWARRFIEAAGFALRPESHALPDHIAVELELMQRLAAETARKLEQGESGEVERWRGLEAEFLGHHPAVWAPAFCDRVVARARLPFYRAMAKLTKDFIASEQSLALEAFGRFGQGPGRAPGSREGAPGADVTLRPWRVGARASA